MLKIICFSAKLQRRSVVSLLPSCGHVQFCVCTTTGAKCVSSIFAQRSEINVNTVDMQISDLFVLMNKISPLEKYNFIKW